MEVDSNVEEIHVDGANGSAAGGGFDFCSELGGTGALVMTWFIVCEHVAMSEPRYLEAMAGRCFRYPMAPAGRGTGTPGVRSGTAPVWTWMKLLQSLVAVGCHPRMVETG